MPENTLFSYRVSEDRHTLFDPDNPLWQRAEHVAIDRYWNGIPALKEAGYRWKNLTRVASLWNNSAIFFYFQCWYDTLHVFPDDSLRGPFQGLWDRDVIEIFLRPESCEDYFEIEVSPLGQWLDVHVLLPRVDVDFSWRSGLELEVCLRETHQTWTAFVRLPYGPMMEASAFSKLPGIGDAWRLNLYRIVGQEPHREYLAWRPTYTRAPDFHVPAAFGNLLFLDG